MSYPFEPCSDGIMLYIENVQVGGESIAILIDESQQERISRFTYVWQYRFMHAKPCVVASVYRNKKPTVLFLEQYLLGVREKDEVIFLNGNRLDFRLHNLKKS